MKAWYREEFYDWSSDRKYWADWKELNEGKHGFSHVIDVTFEEPLPPLADGIYVAPGASGLVNEYNIYKKESGSWTHLSSGDWVEALVVEADDAGDLTFVGRVL